MWPTATPPTRAEVADDFGIDVGELASHAGGFEADAFTDGRWFVKLWRFELYSDAALTLTVELAARGLPVPAAVRALDGTFPGQHGDRRYSIFPFVEGHSATWADADAIGRAVRNLHEQTDIDLPRTELDEWCIEALRDRYDHPWIAGHRDELTMYVDRLEAVIERARAVDVRQVVCHHDLLPHNVLVDDRGRITALLDWGHTMLAPREHDLFAGFCGEDPEPMRYLQAYGAEGLDLTHLEYARLARSLRDLAARVTNEVDREGVDRWGFDGLRQVDADLAVAARFA
jgi:hypothetical protein